MIIAYLGQTGVGKVIERQRFLLSMAMFQVLSLVDASSANSRQAHAITYKDDNILRLPLIRGFLCRFRLSYDLLELL